MNNKYEIISVHTDIIIHEEDIKMTNSYHLSSSVDTHDQNHSDQGAHEVLLLQNPVVNPVVPAAHFQQTEEYQTPNLQVLEHQVEPVRDVSWAPRKLLVNKPYDSSDLCSISRRLFPEDDNASGNMSPRV